MFGLGAAVYAIVAFFIVWAIVRGRRRADAAKARSSDNTWIVWGGVVVPVVILGGARGRDRAGDIASCASPKPNALQVHVVGKRWWWQVSLSGHAVHDRERDPSARRAGPVEIHLDSDNVIHSFWVPSSRARST